MDSKWIKDLNTRPNAIKFLKETIGMKLTDNGLGNNFGGIMP